ncbi:hypothetical protein SOCEGT47_072480 [Sorangium cellulosum]|uniref:Secreted protein n=1 Tax=Sorangium cellulosum TaxID=56 RepID=A0A4P2QBI1_SORCE|nr:hypothetical protein [Sorangium cellulosum]AUX26678.1 hypothetical protein SOCEGT47_072480 [Sorangium cellulosum]
MKQSNNVPSLVRGCLRPLSAMRSALSAAALGAGASLLMGCLGTVGAEGYVVSGYPAARAEAVPVEITAYPRVFFRGTYAYLVDGLWYYPTNRGWVVFEEEPAELRRYRQTYRRSPRYVPERELSYPRERGRRYYTPR